MVDMVAKAKALILGLLASAATTAATVDLTLPPGDYYLVPVQPYTVVTIHSQPIDPPVLDTDGDGVSDDIDQCPETPLGDEVDATGCTVVQPPVDTDGDGVPDDVDACPDETAQTADGCPVVIPPDPTEPPPVVTGSTIQTCIDALTQPGFCEMQIDALAVWRDDVTQPERGVTGPRSAWIAWNGAAVNYPKMWFHGGGHNNSGMIDVYELNLESGTLSRIYTPPPFDIWYCKPETTSCARRHDPNELPESTHTYDGFTYDPETGLLILVTGVGYTFGFEDHPELTPDMPDVFTEPGRGIWAFNPGETTIKGVAPKSWRRLSATSPAGGYPHMAYHAGRYWIGGIIESYAYMWDGDDFVQDVTQPILKTAQHGPATFDAIDGELWAKNKYRVHGWDSDLDKLPEPLNANYTDQHGYTVSKYLDKFLFWDGKRKVLTLDMDGNWSVCDFSDEPYAGGAQPVYSKWFRAPGHDDIYVGWQYPESGPLVYRHSDDACALMRDYTEPDIGKLLNESTNVVLPDDAYYQQGPVIDATDGVARSVDFNNAIFATSQPNGWVIAKGGPISLRRLKADRPSRAGVWAQNTPVLTVEDSVIASTQFGIVTSNDGGSLTIRNTLIQDIKGGLEYGKQHNVYAGHIDSVDVDGLLSVRSHNGGHLFKSRAPVNIIKNSLFDGGDSNHSRILDFPCGGHIEIRNSEMIQSANSDNQDLIAVAVEKPENCPHMIEESTLILENTRWESKVHNPRFMTTYNTVNIECLGTNEFVGVASPCQE